MGAPQPAACGCPDSAVRGEAEVGDVIVGDGGIALEVLCDKAGVAVYYIEPGMGGGIDQIALGILDDPASEP